MDIGKQVKELRNTNKISLRELSKRTMLSTGFLSQFERGLTSIAVDSLAEIAKALDVELSYFFKIQASSTESDVIHAHEQNISLIESDKYIHYYLSKRLETSSMFPEVVTIVPGDSSKSHSLFNHDGEEFIYVLEGILTVNLGEATHQLYPGDSAHFTSKTPHNWYNTSRLMAKVLVVHLPNPFKEKDGI